MVIRAYLRGDKDALPLVSNTTLIGNSKECDIYLNDVGVSERHLVLEFFGIDQKMLLTDLGRGTIVNRQLVRDATIEIGPKDTIKLGNKLFQLVFNTKITSEFKLNESTNQGSLVNREKMKRCEIRFQNQQTAANLMPLTSTYRPKTSEYQFVDTLPTLNSNGYNSDSKTTVPISYANRSNTHNPYYLQNTSTEDLQKLVKDKDKKIVEMLEEINKLSNIEDELREKDQVISAMKQHNLNNNSANTLEYSCYQNNSNNNKSLFKKITEENQRNEKLIGDFNDVKRSYQSSQGLVHSLQTEISNKEAQILKQSKQINCLRKQLKQSDLKVSSMSVRCKKLAAENNTRSIEKQLTETKSKVRTLETRLGNQMELLEKYKNQLTMTNNNQLKFEEEKKRTTRELNDLKQKYYNVQRDEKVLKVKFEQSEALYDKFKTKLVYLIRGAEPRFSDNIHSDGHIIQTIQTGFNERNQLQMLTNNLEKSLEQYKNSEENFKKGMKKIITELKLKLETLQISGRTCKNIKKHVEEILIDESEFKWVSKLVSNCLQGELESKMNFQEQLSNLDIVAEEDKTENEYLLEISNKLIKSNEAKSDYGKEILHLKNEHNFQIEKVKKNIHETLSKEHQLAFEKSKQECQLLYDDQLQNALKEQKSELENVLQDEFKKIEIAEKMVEEKNILLEDKESQILELRNKLDEANKSIKEKTTIEEQKSEEMLSIQEACEKRVQEATEKTNKAVEEAKEKVKQYEEETKQHALTIVSLENKIKDKMKYKKERKNSMSTQTLNRSEDTTSTDSVKGNLVAELDVARQNLQYQQDRNTKLSRDLKSAESRLSDMKGEISEMYKVEIEFNRSTVKKLQIENSESQQQLLKLTEIVKEKKTEISTLNKINEAKEEQICQLVREKKLQVSEKKLATSDQSCEVAIPEKNNPEWVENRHQEVITRQREAIVELREQVKALKQLQAPLSGEQNSLEQVVIMKRELAEIKAQKSPNKEENTKANHLLLAATAQADLERNSQNELLESVIASEKSYLDVVNTISQLIGLDQLIANRSFSQLPNDEKNKLVKDRKKDLESIVNRLSNLQSTIKNKDQLLQGYETTLKKVRIAEEKAKENFSHVELLRRSLVDKTEKISHLRKELDETRSLLNEEKILNSSIKTRKQHNCKELYPTTNSSNQKSTCSFLSDNKSGNKSKEAKRRRNYELEVLKNKRK